jgi:hypothetical protein
VLPRMVHTCAEGKLRRKGQGGVGTGSSAIGTDISMKLVYKITYPNGKIYVGMDLLNEINNFGSPDNKLIAADFSAEQRQSFTVTREILWQSESATDSEVRAKEIEFIHALRSNDPKIRYNRTPKIRMKPTCLGLQ